jgi:hypothetical protein
MLFKTNKTFKIVLLATGFFMAVTFIITELALKKIEKQVRNDIGNALQVVVKSTKEAHIIWVENQKDYLKQLSRSPKLISLVRKHIKVPRTPQELINSQSLKELRVYFDARTDQSEDIGFFIITSDNINIASNLDATVGDKILTAEEPSAQLEKAFNGEAVFVLPIQSEVALNLPSAKRRPTMFFAAPIKSKDKVLAVLALQMDPNQDFTRITQIGRIGKTGETYAFDQSGLLISNSRFDDQLHQIGLINKNENGILTIRISDPGKNLLQGYTPLLKPTQRPLTLMARSAVSGNSGVNVQGYRDYRGVTVLGAWLWNSELEYGLATEIDEDEALNTFNTTKWTIISIITITVCLSLALALIIFWLEQRASKAEINTIRGMIPICSNCKKIRDDKGYWNQVESYIHEHSEAEFTHGICPECEKKLYPEFYREKRDG